MHHRYIKGLDGLRAVAILWVMFGHISSSLNWPVTEFFQKPFNLLQNMGWVGVQLFFVLSGFLITRILMTDKGKPHFLRNFYIRRSLRIFPIYYLMLVLFFILLPLLGSFPSWLGNAVNDQLWYWLYLQNWIRAFSDQGALAPYWSLAIEEQYYLIWPLMILSLNPKQLKFVCFLMILSAPVFRTGLYHYMPLWFDVENIGKAAAYNFTFARWDAIAIGSLIALYVGSDNELKMMKIAKYVFVLGSIIILIQLAVLSNFTSVAPGIGMLNQTTISLVFGSIIVLVYFSKQSHWFVNLLEYTPIKSIGKVSYAMYLFHLPLAVIWINYWSLDFSNHSSFVTLLLVFLHYSILVVVTYLLAQISWKIFEHPILRFKDRFNS
jgi:peptidoglycan/LPS O-acetylase OafA/YrhL